MRNIYLVRHGEPEGVTRRYIGITDVPLSKRGRKEADALGARLYIRCRKDSSPIRIVSSPLSRCVETAEGIRAGVGECPMVVADDLHEVDLGTWDGQKTFDIRMRYPNEYEERGRNLWHYRTPRGESLEEAAHRFDDALDNLRKKYDEDLIVVAHAGVIRGWISLKTGREPEECLGLELPYGSGFRATEDYYGNIEINTEVHL